MVAVSIGPAFAQNTLKGPDNTVRCDCTNCSAEHCQPPSKGGGGKSGGHKNWILIESMSAPSKDKSLKAPQ